jgi:putative transposase
MSAAKCTDQDYIDFLIATPRICTATEAARVQPAQPDPPAHDAFTRLLHRLEPDAGALWDEVRPLVHRGRGVLVLDDTTLDKPYARHLDLVCWHWSGKHRAVVKGINLLTLVWTDGDTLQPCDYRIYHKAKDGQTQNDLFRQLLEVAHRRGFQPACVRFDSWYASNANLKLCDRLGYRWLTRLKANRKVSRDGRTFHALEQTTVSPQGATLHLQGYGPVKIFAILAKDGQFQYWATADLSLTELERLQYAELSWSVEDYHRGLKQYGGAERAQVRAEDAQRNHIGLAIRAFVRLEYHRFRTGVSWFEAKFSIIRAAVRLYISQPVYVLP